MYGLVCLAMLCISPVVPGQASSAIGVYVEHSGEDRVGVAVAYELREQLRRSAGYPLVADAAEAGIWIILISLDNRCPDISAGSTASVSATYIVNNQQRAYLTGSLHQVGRNKTEAVARTLAAELDRQVHIYRRLYQYQKPPDDPLGEKIDDFLSKLPPKKP